MGSAATMPDNPNAPQSGIISRKEQLDPETRARCVWGVPLRVARDAC